MSYRTILVHVDPAPQTQERLRCAIALARDFDAHLVGCAVSGVSRYIMPGSLETGADLIAEQVAHMRASAARSLAAFDAQVMAAGLASHEHRYVDDDFDGGLSLQANYADLLVLGQSDPAGAQPGMLSESPEYLLMNTVRPILVLPYAGKFERLGQHCVVAWNGSREAARAVSAALPLLKKARQVTVLVFNPQDAQAAHGQAPGADLALFLARHGVQVEVSVRWCPADVGAALLASLTDLDADLLVMGAYGHTRWRELLLGGATRSIFKNMTLPVLLAH